MAIAIRGAAVSTAVRGNSGDVTVDLTGITGLAQNDIVLVGHLIGSTSDESANLTIVTGTGWTEGHVANAYGSSTQRTSLGLHYKFMGATPDTSITLKNTTGGTDGGGYGIAMAFSGVDTGTPFDVSVVTAGGNGTSLANPGSIDWTNTGTATVIICAGAHTRGGAGDMQAPTNYGTGWAERDLGINIPVDGSIGMGYNLSPSDPEDPAAVTYNNGSDAGTNSWGAITIALRESGAGGADVVIAIPLGGTPY